jgi:hypothetical protein
LCGRYKLGLHLLKSLSGWLYSAINGLNIKH